MKHCATPCTICATLETTLLTVTNYVVRHENMHNDSYDLIKLNCMESCIGHSYSSVYNCKILNRIRSTEAISIAVFGYTANSAMLQIPFLCLRCQHQNQCTVMRSVLLCVSHFLQSETMEEKGFSVI